MLKKEKQGGYPGAIAEVPKSAGSLPSLKMDINMNKDYDIAQERRSIKASWSAFGWIVTVFGLVALAGWLLAQ